MSEGGFAQVKIGDLEQGAGSLAGRRSENRSVDQGESTLVEEVANGFLHRVTHPQDDILTGGAQPQVPPLHQVGDAVLLGSDRIVLGFMDDVELLDRQLETQRAALIGADQTPHAERRFLTQVIRLLKKLWADVSLEDHRLNDSGTIPDLQEMQFAGRPLVVQPPANLHLLGFVLGDFRDSGDRHGHAADSTTSPSREKQIDGTRKMVRITGDADARAL